MSDSIEINEFDEPIRGQKTFIPHSIEYAISQFLQVEAMCLYKGKNILVIDDMGQMPHSPNPLILRKRWDVIFRIKTAFDAQMIATYVSYSEKPSRIFWIGHPNGGTLIKNLWVKWISSDITLIASCESGNITGCDWDLILFPVGCQQDTMNRILVSRNPLLSSMLSKISSHLTDITTSKAGIAWSSIQTSNANGSLFWYDPSNGKKLDSLQPFTKQEASALLHSIAKWIDA